MSASSCLASTPAYLLTPSAFRAANSCKQQKMDCTYPVNDVSPKNLHLLHEFRQLLNLLQQQQSTPTSTTSSSDNVDVLLQPRLDTIPLQYSAATAPIQLDVSGLGLLLASLTGGQPLCSTVISSANIPCSMVSNGTVSAFGTHPAVLQNPLSVTTENFALASQNSNMQTLNKAPTDGVCFDTNGQANHSTTTPPNISCDKLSSNLLHQLLSGVDATQVRHRSGLIEPVPAQSSVRSQLTSLKCESPDDISSTYDVASYRKASPSSRSESSCVSSETSTMTEGSELSMQRDFTHSSSPHIASEPTPVPTSQPPTTSQLNEVNSSPLSALLAERLMELLRNTSFPQPNISIPTTTVTSTISVSTLSVNDTCATGKLAPRTPPVQSSPGLRRLLCQNSVSVTPPYPNDPSGTLPHLAQSSNRITGGCGPPGQCPNTDLGASTENCSQTRSTEQCSPEPQQKRPRSHSDVHNGMRYSHKVQQYHRPRSYSKLERPLVRHQEEADTENLNHEIQSSLFARLVLSTDPSPPPPTVATTNTDKPIRELVSPPRSPITQPMFTDQDSINSAPLANTVLTCDSMTRNHVFEWLLEADLFVAEHCRDIPLGALLAVAISPCRTSGVDLYSSMLLSSPIPADGIPSSSKRILSRIWHQFLLISMIENNFTALQVCNRPAVKHNNPSSSSSNSSSIGDVLRRNQADSEREKWLNAINSLMELQLDDAPPPDQHLVNELIGVIEAGSSLGLNPKVYESIRFCILAQNAYPHHFSTSYPEALSELETELSRTTANGASFTEVLKILNRLHCFDAGTLKQFFSLSTDPIQNATADQTDVQNPPPHCLAQQLQSLFPGFPAAGADSNHTSGTCKRKARNHRSSDRELSPVLLRSRAYTTNSYNKSVRLSQKPNRISRAKDDTMSNVNQNCHP